MIFSVHVFSGPLPEVRLVDIGGESPSFRNIFYYGQNDVCPLPVPSISAGDVVEWCGHYYMFGPADIVELSVGEFATYCRMDVIDRINFRLRQFSTGRLTSHEFTTRIS